MLHIISVHENQIPLFQREFIRNIYSLPKIRYFFPTPFQFNYEVKLSSNNNFDACIIILSVRDILAH